MPQWTQAIWISARQRHCSSVCCLPAAPWKQASTVLQSQPITSCLAISVKLIGNLQMQTGGCFFFLVGKHWGKRDLQLEQMVQKWRIRISKVLTFGDCFIKGTATAQFWETALLWFYRETAFLGFVSELQTGSTEAQKHREGSVPLGSNRAKDKDASVPEQLTKYHSYIIVLHRLHPLDHLGVHCTQFNHLPPSLCSPCLGRTCYPAN